MHPLGPVRFLTLHCAATPEGRAHSAEEVTRWDAERFGQPSYHWVVTLDGVAHRTLPDEQRGAHVGAHNSGNIGICHVGGMDAAMRKSKDTRTGAQRQTRLRLVRDYQAEHPGIVVLGHRDWPGVAKACPSFDVRAWLKAEGPPR
jgi:N-acetylmuramoyl-L-alanine amidase